MATLKLNRLPVPTYRWLGVNGAEAEVNAAPVVTPSVAVPKGVACMEQTLPQDQSADGNALAAFFAQNQVTYYTLEGSAGEAVRVQISDSGAAGFRINVPANGQMTVIMQLGAGECALHTSVQAGDSARVKLVQIVAGGRYVGQLDAQLADSAAFELVQLYLGGDSVSGITVNETGRRAAFTSHLGYLLDGGDQLDINLNIIQNGKKTLSDTDVKGVLRGRSKKTFRGTIDFRHGAEGAKGAEREDVLLMDETVRNKTVPVILCAEEDVEGSHGASIGQLDASHIFYLQSRGIPTERIYEMMAQSKLGSIIRQIGDAETEREANRLIGKEDSDAADGMEG